MEYILDIATWRSGGRLCNPHRWGEGATRMKNDEGFMCCLGQFARQFGVTPVGETPADTAQACGRDYDPAMVVLRTEYPGSDRQYARTPLAARLMRENDGLATPGERVANIRSMLEEAGHTLLVENEHLLEQGVTNAL